MPNSLPRESRDIHKSVIAIVGVAVIVIAAAGLYFGTDLFRKSVSETARPAPEPMAKVVERPAATPAEVAKVDNPPAGSEFDWPGLSNVPPEVPAPVEASKAIAGALPKPAPSASEAAQARKAQSKPLADSSRAGARANKASAPAVASRHQTNPGTYETIRPTTVFEQASGSSRVIANIGGGTKVNVVGSTGDWLEVRSRVGNPRALSGATTRFPWNDQSR
jgi:hypothetical protein